MDVAEHIACLEREGELLALAADGSPLDAPVPTCPGWRMRDLLAHLGFVHRWAAGYVTGGRTEMTPVPGEDEVLELGPADESLRGWFRAGHAALVAAVRGADPSLRCWTFLSAPSPLAFWARRQAHETAIHRVDAQLAAAAASPAGPGIFPAGPASLPGLDPFPAGLPADGIDEVVTDFAGRNPRRLSAAPAVLVIRARDGAASATWTVVMGQDGAGVFRGADGSRPGQPGPAERGTKAPERASGRRCDVSGPAAELYLLLWNRRTADGVDVHGDARVLADWRENLRVRWR